MVKEKKNFQIFFNSITDTINNNLDVAKANLFI